RSPWARWSSWPSTWSRRPCWTRPGSSPATAFASPSARSLPTASSWSGWTSFPDASEPAPQPPLLEPDLPPVPDAPGVAQLQDRRRFRVEVSPGVGGHTVAHFQDSVAVAFEGLRRPAARDLGRDALGHDLGLVVGEDFSLGGHQSDRELCARHVAVG